MVYIGIIEADGFWKIIYWGMGGEGGNFGWERMMGFRWSKGFWKRFGEDWCLCFSGFFGWRNLENLFRFSVNFLWWIFNVQILNIWREKINSLLRNENYFWMKHIRAIIIKAIILFLRNFFICKFKCIKNKFCSQLTTISFL